MAYFTVVGFSREPGFTTTLELRKFPSRNDFVKWLNNGGSKEPGVRVLRRGLTKKEAQKVITSGAV